PLFFFLLLACLFLAALLLLLLALLELGALLVERGSARDRLRRHFCGLRADIGRRQCRFRRFRLRLGFGDRFGNGLRHRGGLGFRLGLRFGFGDGNRIGLRHRLGCRLGGRRRRRLGRILRRRLVFLGVARRLRQFRRLF